MSKRGRVFLNLIGLLFLLPAAGSYAAPSSQELVQKGHQYLTQKKFEQALRSFEQASKAAPHPEEGQALFFQGVTLNRLGRFQEAGGKLDQSKKFGTHSEWTFERGWAHLGNQEWKQAIDLLKAYEKKSPGRGQTSEFLGRAYYRLNKLDQAEKYFDEAVQRAPELKETVHVYRAAIAQSERGRPAPAARGEERRWAIFSNIGGLYNANAINLGSGAALPRNISRQDSAFSTTSVGGNYKFRLNDRNQLWLGHQFLANLFEVTEALHMTDNFSSIQFRRVLGDKQAFGFTVGNEFTTIQTAKFRNQVSVRPVFGWRLTDWLTTEGQYLFTWGEYFFPSNANQNRDGNAHTVGLNNYLSIPDTNWRFLLGYDHRWNLADGNDFDLEGNTMAFAVSHPLFWEVSAELFFNQAWNRYNNANSLTANTRRSDDISNVVFQVNYPVFGAVRSYLRAGYTRNRSNINTFNYRAQYGGMGFLIGI